jgi:hypothetical protein
MTQVKVTPYTPKHLADIEFRGHEQVNMKRDKLGVILDETIGVSLIDADTKSVIAILGYLAVAPGLIEVFVVPSKNVSKYCFGFVRAVKRYLASLETVIPEYRRMETRSLADPPTDRWMQALGFVCEGTHRKYAPDGSDYRTWARIVND